MIDNTMTLGVRENEQIRRETKAVVRACLESCRPDVAQFVVEDNEAVCFIANTGVTGNLINPERLGGKCT
jgi:glutamate mutase epsilon subunit